MMQIDDDALRIMLSSDSIMQCWHLAVLQHKCEGLTGGI